MLKTSSDPGGTSGSLVGTRALGGQVVKQGVDRSNQQGPYGCEEEPYTTLKRVLCSGGMIGWLHAIDSPGIWDM